MQKILKKKSQDRVAGWSDTLESKRNEKLRWKQDVLDREEAKRIEMDQMEAKRRETELQSLLTKAKAMQYEEHEKVKLLRSQQLYTEVMETRQEQIQRKASRNKSSREEEREWHDSLMNELKREEAKRDYESNLMKTKAIENAVFMRQQKQDVDMIKQDLNKTRMADEQASIRQIEKEAKAARDRDIQQKIHSKEKAKQEMEQIAIDTEIKKNLDLEREANEQRKRDKDTARMKLIAKTRVDLERQHFEEKQAARKILSDKASQDLQLRAEKEIEIFIRDQKAQESKEQAILIDKEMKKKKMEEEIRISRQSQIEKRLEQKRLDLKADHDLARTAREKINQETENDRVKQLERTKQNYEYRMFQEKQIRENKINRRSAQEAVKAEDENVS